MSRVETRAPSFKPLKIQASPVFGLRFLRLASAPERTRTRRRSKLQPRRLHSSHKQEWNNDDRDLLLKSANRPRYTESSGVRIRAFVEEAENFLEMCGRPRDRWARFVDSWLGSNEAEKVRRSHFVDDNVEYNTLLEGLFTLFGPLDYEDAYRQQLRVLVQSGAEQTFVVYMNFHVCIMYVSCIDTYRYILEAMFQYMKNT